MTSENTPPPDFSLRAQFPQRPPRAATSEPTRAERKDFFRMVEAGNFDGIREVMAKYPGAQNWQCPGGMHHGKTPLIMAVYGATPAETIKFLLQNGAEIDKADKTGCTPLAHAVFSNNIALAELLLANRAAPDSCDQYGETPLMAAAANNQWECADLLVIAGARIEKRNNYGRSALDIAKRNNHAEIIDIMKAAAERLAMANAEKKARADLPETSAEIRVAKPIQLKK